VARARTRLEALADRLAELRRRLGQDESPGAQPTQTFEATHFGDEEKDPGRVL